MSDNYRFSDSGKKFDLYVHTDFLKVCPNPSEFDYKVLLEQYNMFWYLHRTDGPAVTRLKDGATEFWVYEKGDDGLYKPNILHAIDPDTKRILDTPETLAIKHKMGFNKKLEEVLGE